MAGEQARLPALRHWGGDEADDFAMRRNPRDPLEHANVAQRRIGVRSFREVTQRFAHQLREAETDSMHRALSQRRDARVVEVQAADRIVVAEHRAVLEFDLGAAIARMAQEQHRAERAQTIAPVVPAIDPTQYLVCGTMQQLHGVPSANDGRVAASSSAICATFAAPSRRPSAHARAWIWWSWSRFSSSELTRATSS